MPGPLIQRAGVRFAALYGGLYLLPFPFSLFSSAAEVRVWRPASDAIGAAIGRALGIAVQTPTYTGDAMARYLFIGGAAVVSLVAACVWAWLDRSPARDQRLGAWVRLYFRFALATFLIDYGSVKVIPAQFPAPSLAALHEPIGDASPMGLLWAFIGASYGYALFGGVLEMLAGALLLFRRTALAGALLACMVMGRIVALNLGYDVPQKQLSIHLFLLAAYVLAPAIPSLAAVLSERPAPAAARPVVPPHRARLGAVTGAAFLAYLVMSTLANAAANEAASGASAPRSPLRGVWLVEEFSVEGGPDAAPSERWRRVIFDGPERIGLRFEDGSYQRLSAVPNEAGTALTFSREDGRHVETRLGTLGVDRADADHCVLAGRFEGRAVRVRLARGPVRPFLLERRGFHWVSESEFIR